MRAAFQGEHGAFGEEAILKHFGGSVETYPRPSLREVFEAVERGEADRGVVPAENTLEGTVVQTYDLILGSHLRIQAEVVLRIVHCLVALPGVSLGDIRRVYSHPQALGQCRSFLEERRLEAVATYNTAGSVKMLREGNLRDAAAIASARAAEVYGMAILARGIEAHPENYTRFLVLGQEDRPPTGRDKTSVAFALDHAPGTLFRALKGFADEGVNLTRIESRPIVGRPWEYTFYLDFEGHREEPRIRTALGGLEACSRFLKILGSYPQAENVKGINAREG